MTSDELFNDQSEELTMTVEEPKKGAKKKGAKAELIGLPRVERGQETIGNRPLRMGFLLHLKEPVTHGDPGTGDKSNISRLRREPMLRERVHVGDTETVSDVVLRMQKAFPVPKEVAVDWQVMTPSQYLAAVLFRACYDVCYQWDADRRQVCFGYLRSAPDKSSTLWESVAHRLQQCAVSASSARDFVSAVLRSVQIKSVEPRHDAMLAVVYGMSWQASELALREIRDNAAMTVSDVRRWVKAEWVGTVKADVVVMEPLQYADAVGSQMEVIRVPEVSGVSIRHHIRAGCSRHLLHHIGIGSGAGEFSPDIERILQNGGAMYTGSQQTKSDRIMATRHSFPSLDLLGGCLPDTMLGQAQLLLHTPRLVCRETASVLPASVQALPQATTPAEDQVGIRSYARAAMAGESDGMPYSREVILEGAVIYVGMTVRPYTSVLTVGALVAGVEDWWNNAAGIGGAQANGFGKIAGQWLFDGDEYSEESLAIARNQYEEFLATNAEGLASRLRSGRVDEV